MYTTISLILCKCIAKFIKTICRTKYVQISREDKFYIPDTCIPRMIYDFKHL